MSHAINYAVLYNRVKGHFKFILFLGICDMKKTQVIIYLLGLLSFLLQYFIVFTAQVLHLMIKFILTWFVFHALIHEIIFLLAIDCRGIEIKLIFVF